MISKLICAVISTCILVTCTTDVGDARIVSSVGTYNGSYSLQIERGRNIVAPAVRRGSGVTVAVGVDGHLVWSEGFGYTSLKQDSQVAADAPLRLYSLIKQVTTVLALQSVLRGEITFSTTAREVLPELPNSYDDVTLQHLLTHTSGVRHYYHPAEALFFNHCESAQSGLERFTNDPLVHEAGARQSYSTYGFVLASAMLERVSNLSFPELLSQRLAQPAGLQTIQLESREFQAVNYYDVDDDGNVSTALPVDNSCKMGGGGFLSSAEDLVRFHNAVINGDLAPEPAVRQLLGGRNKLEAGGSGVGGEAVSIADLDARISVVVLSNTGGLEQQIALQRIRDLLVTIFEESSSEQSVVMNKI